MKNEKARIEKLKEKLDKLGVSYEINKHPPIKTVEDGLQYLGISAADGISTLILKADGQFITVLRRDDHEMDLDKIKKSLGIKKLKLASEKEILEQSGAPKGATPLITRLPTFIDKTILEREYIYGGTGSFEHDLKIKPKDLQLVTQAKLLDIIETEDKMSKKRVFSGIRASGKLHIGNYLGAVKGMLELQDKFDCIFSVVDLHTITTPFKPKELQEQIRDVILDYLACGLDPKKCHLMVQSQVPEHVELAYLLGTIYPVSRLEDLPTYKEKKLENPEYINMGLLYYPVLMAADILIYKAELVPVGKDQVPHIEVTREFARIFNRMFSKVFPEPKAYLMEGASVPSLRGEGKMSKSVEGSYILLTDDLKTIRKRLAGAPTDIGKGSKVPESGGVANLLTLVELFEGIAARKEYERQYLNEGIRYQDLKHDLANAIYQHLKPIQEQRKYFEQNPKLVEEILEEGREYCSQIAQQTLKEVKEKMGLV